jgi:DNA polymerase-3 subunit delta'
MPLLPLAGHVTERTRVAQAIAGDRLPQLLLVTGPEGVGKQRFALWVAQALLCDRPAREAGEPCGVCQPCRLVSGLAHPDLHWLVPVPRPKAAEPDRQVEELEEALAGVMEARRTQPLYQPPDGMAGHFVATARLLQRRAALTPVMGRRKVFIVAAADRLVPQESSPEAANALLKLFEEPPADCQFLLTAADPNRLLPTIRSRAVPLRLGRLADEEVRAFLAAHAGLSGAELERRVREARGSIGRALALGGDRDATGAAVEELLATLKSGPSARAERALRQGTWQARGEFTGTLDGLADALSEAARQASGAEPRQPLPQALAGIRSVAALAQAAERVARAREAAQGNVNPQLILAVLEEELAEVLWRR